MGEQLVGLAWRGEGGREGGMEEKKYEEICRERKLKKERESERSNQTNRKQEETKKGANNIKSS